MVNVTSVKTLYFLHFVVFHCRKTSCFKVIYYYYYYLLIEEINKMLQAKTIFSTEV